MPRTLTVPQLADELAGDGLIYIPGSAGEPTPLLDLWAADPERTRGARILTSLVPGINRLAMDALHPTATVTGLFMQPAWQAGAGGGAVPAPAAVLLRLRAARAGAGGA